MNDTPQGDGNARLQSNFKSTVRGNIRMSDTPQGDGNTTIAMLIYIILIIRMNDTPQGDGNNDRV